MDKKPKINKVLFLQCFPLWGCGSGTYTRELATEINKAKKIKTAIVCPESKEKHAGVKIYPLELPFPVAFTGHPDWPVCRLYKDLTPKEISQVFNFFLRSVIRAVDDFHPDLIHVQHISLLLWVANFIKALYGINFIVTSHGTGVLTASEKKIFIASSQDALRRVKKIVAVSGDTKSWLLRVFGKEFSHKTRIIPGGVYLENFPPERKIRIINKKYKLKGKKVVLFSGKLTPQKGVFYLINAANGIKGDIYILGDGPEKKNLEDLTYKLKLENVHFLGYMGDEKKEELEEFYYRADVFVAPSVWDEPLGLVILEAMAGKTPVIATRKGGIPLAVKDGINGLLVRPKNSRQITEACNKLLENDELRKKLGEAARKTVEEKFTWKKTAQKYIRIYKKAYTNGNNKKRKNGKKTSSKQKKKKPSNLFRIFKLKKRTS
ncbi:MAG: glycosyltransferase family 4 protein [Candidatus Pacebacteria bacterium]|nr:glycosyltransferase family 4 protein [Candidatus Paceibacterota bacterium]